MIRDVVVKDAGVKGMGVFALRAFEAGDFIFRRRHERIVSNDDLTSLSDDDRRHLCEIDFERSAVLASPGCYLNHSCDPNAMRSGVKVLAWQRIEPGDEITIDYRLNAFDDSQRSQCLCGATSCTGEVTGSFFSLSGERQVQYLPYAPRFIRDEYRRRMVGV